jgi:hypothetical protein
MAGFAIHLRLIHQYSNYIFNVSADSIAQQESQILDTMTTMDQLECLANNASKVFRIFYMENRRFIIFFLICRFMFGIQKLNQCF